ncbi:uncharacterized protein FSUBG_3352 [Fusarium subglutinans]|uniref:Peptidase S1 domain-containing protein n=1 Tax=Gibberella subglutinans TaxID=42677 RepID=A0A8H5Q5T7_GIBSU|nr:uncharacterized protein FSUBG_3352 [Fusarium subglutinans]KAF5610120.1 hypothetical protein FSUBG_3352 [Fusarium subglutinans]
MDELLATPPSREESRSYYRGLPGIPRLVARSTTTPWDGPFSEFDEYGRILDPVEKHAVVTLWNDSTGPLRHEILEAVADIDWNAIDILRCSSTHFKDRDLVRPVILFVSVEPKSTTWLNGRAVALKCRDILREHGINDVEVEIKESRITQCCSSDQDQIESEPSTAKLSPHIPTLQEEGHRRDSIQVSEFLGTKVAPSRDPSREGTKGLYLRIRNTETVVALTCRHVVVEPEEENIDVCHDPHNSRGIVQPGNKTYQDTPEFLRDQIRRTKTAIDLRESSTPVPDKEIEYLRDYKVELEGSLKRLESFESMESRTIGHVLFSPKLGLSSSSPAHFRDWALIELDQKKHQTPLKKLTNKVPEMRRAIGRYQFMLWEYVIPGRKRMHFSLAGCDTFTQTGVMPEAEMRCPDFEFVVTGKTAVDEEFMRVCMYGSASGVSHGVTNTARSVVRRFVGGVPMVSEEWCILGPIQHEKRKHFSKQGDSGASIMADDGRVVAILTCGGSGALGCNRGIHDVSYATPIEWLLEDIRGHGYDVEWMGKEFDLDYLHFRL